MVIRSTCLEVSGASIRLACAEQIELAQQLLDASAHLFALASKIVQLFGEMLHLLAQFIALVLELFGPSLEFAACAVRGFQLILHRLEALLYLRILVTQTCNDLHRARDPLLEIG